MDERENVIDRYEIRKELYEAIAQVAENHGITTIELVGMLAELNAGIIVDMTIQEIKQENMQ